MAHPANSGISAPILSPIAICTASVRGPVLTFEAHDTGLLACGIAEPEELPGLQPGCKVWFDRKFGGVGSFRMPDGRVRFKIRSSIARRRDSVFVGFLASLLPLCLNGSKHA